MISLVVPVIILFALQNIIMLKIPWQRFIVNIVSTCAITGIWLSVLYWRTPEFKKLKNRFLKEILKL